MPHDLAGGSVGCFRHLDSDVCIKVEYCSDVDLSASCDPHGCHRDAIKIDDKLVTGLCLHLACDRK